MVKLFHLAIIAGLVGIGYFYNKSVAANSNRARSYPVGIGKKYYLGNGLTIGEDGKLYWTNESNLPEGLRKLLASQTPQQQQQTLQNIVVQEEVPVVQQQVEAPSHTDQSNIIQHNNKVIAANHPPGTIITGGSHTPEAGKEDYKPYGYIEPSTFVPDHLLDSTFDTDDLPTIKDPREVQAELLEQQWRAGQLEHFKTIVYPPLTEAQIAMELQRHPIGWEAKPGWRIRTEYPGFVTRSDGLLQWDGHTIPDFLQGAYEEGMRCTSGEESTSQSPEDLVYCASRREKLRYILEELKNRPWYPGYDLTNDPNLAIRPGTSTWDSFTGQFGGQSLQNQIASCGGDQDCVSQVMAHQQFSQQIMPAIVQPAMDTFRNMADINYLFGRPSVMLTAQEELARMQNPPAYLDVRRQQSAIYNQMQEERRNLISGNLDPGEAELIAQRQAEREAREAAFQQWYQQTKQTGYEQALAELQQWV